MARYSVETLAARLNLPTSKARAVKRLLEDKLSPNKFRSVITMQHQAYNPHPPLDCILCALNELLGGFGVEPIRGDWWDNYFGDCVAEYINMGDTYDTTILYDCVKNSFVLTSWGDWVERNTRKYKIA